MIATDVLEEGIDVQECNLVIMFDPVLSFRSYIQSKGRARMKGGEYIILNDVGRAVDPQVEEFRRTDGLLNHVSVTFAAYFTLETWIMIRWYNSYRLSTRKTFSTMKMTNQREIHLKSI